MIETREIRHFHLFGAIGGGAMGFNRGKARVGNMVARFRCLGSVDVDAAANRDFERNVGVKPTTLDLFDRSQYAAFHGHKPPAGWREATPDDIRRAAGYEFPHIVFLSAPCKGFSGLLSENRSRTDKYQALNRLTLRGVWLMLEAFGDEPPELIVFENVPRIATRGRHLLDQIGAMLRQYGYAVAETTHDCGELGGLAQSRKRFLLVARHVAKIPPFLYEPPKHPLAAVGTVLGRMPLPGDPAGGPMHRVPSLQWKTWVRLAFVEAGADWRSLNRLAVQDGYLRDYLIVPQMHNGTMGVLPWESHAGTVADPRFDQSAKWHDGQAYGVRRWSDPSGAITGQKSPGQGNFAVADPRHAGPPKHSNEFRIVRWTESGVAVTGAHGSGQCVQDPRPTYGGDYKQVKYRITGFDEHAGAVISASTTGNGAFAVADPRYINWHPGASRKKMAVTGWDDHAGCVIGAQQVASGALAVADPRPNLDRQKGDHYLTAGHYGVVPWYSHSGAVSSAAGHDNGRWSVADPRIELPAIDDRLVARIVAEDDTWHRPFTTLELAALQGLVDPEEQFELDGLSDSAWRERIGNAVPPPAAEAIAGEMGRTLLLAWSGETFQLSASPIWVRPVAVALAVGVEA
ncbi:MAG: DNA cytosine methyltransferase [Rhodocyclaceae bacterium]|jgi:site-specific DNA-cytosine methylase|nr:DNA cytosine methyltransferase [Rhodocyclaceae bacterium]